MPRPPENTVEQRGYTGARLQPANFGEGRDIAQGVQRLGRGLNDAAENLDKIGEMYDTAAVKRADAEDLKQIMTIRAKALASNGFDSQPAIEEARQRIDEIRKGRLSSLHNSRQRQMYSDVFDQRNLQIEESFANHSVTEIEKANKQSAIARGETYADLAADTYGTEAFETNLGTALNEVANANAGMGADAIGRQKAKVRSQVYSRIISTMSANPDHIQEASSALERHAADILPEDEEKLRKTINPLLEEDQTETDAGWAFTDAPVETYYGEGATSEHPTETSETPPRPVVDTAAPTAGKAPPPISPADPLRGKGKVTTTAEQHRKRGSGNALDIAAPAGTPIYAPMSGKVIKNWWSKEGGWSVLIEHPNGYVTGYAHMRSRSPIGEGRPVEPSIAIGSVGMTGEKATGPHVHYTVRQSKAGPKVDPNAINWGDTVDPKSVSWKESGITKYEPQKNAVGRALDRLYERATKENWSARRYQNAVTRTRQIAGVQEQLYNDNQQQLYDNALKAVVDLGDGLTSRSQVPGFAELEPTRQIAIDNIIKGNKSAKGEAGTGTYFDLAGMAMDPTRRSEFLKVDLLKVQGLTNGERKQLFNMQWGVRNDQDGSYQGSLDEASSAANRYLPTKGFKNETRQKFMDKYMETLTSRQQELKRPLTPREKDDIARGLVVPVVRHRPEGDEKGFLFEGVGRRGEKLEVNIADTFETIPPETVKRIVQALSAAGQRHSKADVVTEYLRQARP